jgi:hypothetical protein
LPLQGPRYIRFDFPKQFNVPVAHIATLSITILACLDKYARHDDHFTPISRTPWIAGYVFATLSQVNDTLWTKNTLSGTTGLSTLLPLYAPTFYAGCKSEKCGDGRIWRTKSRRITKLFIS